jgi:hypothetical protein
MQADQVPESLVDEFRAHGAHSDVGDDLSRAEIREGVAAVLTTWERLRRMPGSLAAELAEAESGRAGEPITAALRERAAMLEDEAHSLMLAGDTHQIVRSKVRSPEHLLLIAAEFTWLADKTEASGGE